LTLAEQVSNLAAQGAARIESMFLDEGFGSLDSDALDTVATAITELGARGRMVGLITHVADLAERVPVQYRVAKGPRTSTIERVAL
jgi:exonuclease SbcC